MTEIRNRSFSLYTCATREESRQVRCIASTDTLDAYGEVVEQDWQLDRYKKNPVVLFNHNYGALFGGPSSQLPIGKCVDIAVKDGQLEATIQFAPAAANPMAEQVWQGVLAGTLRAISVGFRSGGVRIEKRDGVDVTVLSQNELYEISCCPMGANPDAIMKSLTGGNMKRAPTTSDANGQALADMLDVRAGEDLEDEESDDLVDLVAVSTTPTEYEVRARKELSRRYDVPEALISPALVTQHAATLEREEDRARITKSSRAFVDAEIERRRAMGIVDGRSEGGLEMAVMLEEQMD